MSRPAWVRPAARAGQLVALLLILPACSLLPAARPTGGDTSAAAAIPSPAPGPGWHHAVVEGVVADAQLLPALRPACAAAGQAATGPTTAAPGSTLTPARWAVVRYRWFRSNRKVAVPLDADSGWRAGAPVWLSRQGCPATLLSRAPD